jgi:hypothetical protein
LFHPGIWGGYQWVNLDLLPSAVKTAHDMSMFKQEAKQFLSALETIKKNFFLNESFFVGILSF